MFRLLISSAGTACLMAMCAAGVSAAWHAYQEPQPQRSLSDQRAFTGATEPMQINLPSPRPEVFYNATTERPLFAPTRRPAEPYEEMEVAVVEDIEPVEETSEIAPIPEMELLGVFQNGPEETALIRIGEDEPIWIAAGQVEQGWSLDEVNANAVKIHRDDTYITLEMFTQ